MRLFFSSKATVYSMIFPMPSSYNNKALIFSESFSLKAHCKWPSSTSRQLWIVDIQF